MLLLVVIAAEAQSADRVLGVNTVSAPFGNSYLWTYSLGFDKISELEFVEIAGFDSITQDVFDYEVAGRKLKTAYWSMLGASLIAIPVALTVGLMGDGQQTMAEANQYYGAALGIAGVGLALDIGALVVAIKMWTRPVNYLSYEKASLIAANYNKSLE